VNCELCETATSAADGWPYLCANCAADTRDRLELLPDLYDQLWEAVRPLRSNWPKSLDGRRGSRAAHSPALSLGDDTKFAAFAILSGWHQALFDAMGRTVPVLPSDQTAQVKAAVKGLQKHFKWATREWPAAGDFAREVRDLFDDVRTIVGEPDLSHRMGPCPSVHDGEPCRGPLRRPEEAQIIFCPWCGSTYPPGVWVRLKIAQDDLRKAS
jgi:hypothetical protein